MFSFHLAADISLSKIAQILNSNEISQDKCIPTAIPLNESVATIHEFKSMTEIPEEINILQNPHINSPPIEGIYFRTTIIE